MLFTANIPNAVAPEVIEALAESVGWTATVQVGITPVYATKAVAARAGFERMIRELLRQRLRSKKAITAVTEADAQADAVVIQVESA